MTTATEEKDDVKKRLRKGGRGITLKYDGECADCGAFLPKGTTARWYGRGRLYGYTCHTNARPTEDRAQDKVKPEPTQGDMFGADTQQEPEEYTPKNYDCTIH